MESKHPCLSCGACCNVYRVSFHWLETAWDSFQVPKDFTYQVTPHRAAMKTTTPTSDRCTCLHGQVGVNTFCKIYENRPSPCRDFHASYENGIQNPRCDEARQVFNLKPLKPEDWIYEVELQ